MTDSEWLLAAGRLACRLEDDRPTKAQAANGVLIAQPTAQILVWPDFEDALPVGAPLVLLPSDGRWSAAAARAAAALNAAGRPVAAVTTTEESGDIQTWLSNVPGCSIRGVPTTHASAAPPSELEEELAFMAGVAVEVIDLPDPISVQNLDHSPELDPATTLILLATTDALSDEQIRAVPALRAVHTRVLLVAFDGALDPADPWLSQTDVLSVDRHTKTGKWRRAGEPEPRWRTLVEAEKTEEEDTERQRRSEVANIRAETKRRRKEESRRRRRKEAADRTARQARIARLMRDLQPPEQTHAVAPQGARSSQPSAEQARPSSHDSSTTIRPTPKPKLTAYQKADLVQEAGKGLMQIGCGLTGLIVLGVFFVILLIAFFSAL